MSVLNISEGLFFGLIQAL